MSRKHTVHPMTQPMTGALDMLLAIRAERARTKETARREPIAATEPIPSTPTPEEPAASAPRSA